jgi:4-hydroxy-tetrahydrodipicolinate synthase
MDMTKHKFSGTGVALVTPFSEDKSIDFGALKKIVNHVVDQGVEYVVALGTTSEAPVLGTTEKREVVATIKESIAGRVPLVLGMGGNNTAAIVKDIREQTFEGIAGILSVTPYYNKPQQDGLYAHFETIAEASPVPIILYNVPGRTSVNLKAETTLKLARECSNIIAIKEASGDFGQIMQIVAGKPKGFAVLSGDDALTMPLMATGVQGVISVTANACTRDFTDMVRLMLNQEMAAAQELHFKLLPMMEALFADGNPAGIKALLSLMGLCKEELRLPLVPVNHTVRQLIERIYHSIK